MKHKIGFIVVMFLVMLQLCSCSIENDRERTIKDMVGECIYLYEADVLTPYLVISNAYEGNTLLLRQEVLSNKMRMSDYFAHYENCEVDQYLNTDFLLALSESTRNLVVDTDVHVINDDFYLTGSKDIKIIKRKVFLLSIIEVMDSDLINAGMEGSFIKYFSEPSNRIAVGENGTASSWWLRSADATYPSCFYVILSNGKVGSTNAFEEKGIRPAFCIQSDTKVEYVEFNTGEKAYVLKGQYEKSTN